MRKNLLSSFKIIINILSLIKKEIGIIYICFIFVLALLNSILPFFSLINTQNIINGLQNGYMIHSLYKYVLLFIALNILSLISQSTYVYSMGKIKEKLYLYINKEVLKKTKNMELSDFENYKTYDLLQRAEMEAGIRPISIFSNIISLCSSIITLLSSIIILLSWKKWTLIGFLLLPIIAFKYYSGISKLEYTISYNRTTYERKSWYIAHLLTKDSFIKEIKIFDLFRYLYNAFSELRKQFYDENIKVLNKKSIFLFVYQLINQMFMCFIVIVGIIDASKGILMVGTLITYINTTSKVDSSINNISNTFFLLYQDSLYAKNLLDFLNLKTNQKKNTNDLLDINYIREIEFKNVSFKYPNQNKYVLKNLNFKMKSGESIAIVGRNGSGKSTLIKLLCGFYNNYTGEILINGIDLKKIKDNTIKRLVSVVFQDYNQYQFTIRENIGFGDIKNINNTSKIYGSAQKAKIDKMIDSLKYNYDQQVGNWFENGIQLSGGEWQKLALARGFMKNGDVYILDEPTSSLDPISEYNFFETFLKESSSKLSIIITHRFLNAKLADKIIVLENGEVICQGNHDLLIKSNDLYKNMYNLSLYNKEKSF